MDPQTIKTLCAFLSISFTAVAFVPYTVELWQMKGDRSFYWLALQWIHPRLPAWVNRKFPLERIKSADDVQPMISAWLSWVLSDATMFAAQIADKTVAWQLALYVGGPIVLIGLCFRKGTMLARARGGAYTWKAALFDWNHKDTACVAVVVVAILIWVINRNPDHAIYLTSFSLLIGTIAVAGPLYKNPRREMLSGWGLFLIGGIFGLGAIGNWNVTGALPIVEFALLQGLMVALCARRFKPQFKLART